MADLNKIKILCCRSEEDTIRMFTLAEAPARDFHEWLLRALSQVRLRILLQEWPLEKRERWVKFLESEGVQLD